MKNGELQLVLLIGKRTDGEDGDKNGPQTEGLKQIKEEPRHSH